MYVTCPWRSCDAVILNIPPCTPHNRCCVEVAHMGISIATVAEPPPVGGRALCISEIRVECSYLDKTGVLLQSTVTILEHKGTQSLDPANGDMYRLS